VPAVRGRGAARGHRPARRRADHGRRSRDPAGLRGHVNLPRRVEDGPFGAVEPLTRELFFHRFALSSAEEIDQRFLGYLREAARWRG
jgi:hypothetical protein